MGPRQAPADSHVPSAIDSAYFPGSVFRRGRNTQAEVFDTVHGPFRALIVSNLKWGGPCRGHYVFPQADIKSSAFHKGAMKAYRISRTR